MDPSIQRFGQLVLQKLRPSFSLTEFRQKKRQKGSKPKAASEVNPQLASPLFSILPPELRNYVFSLALTPTRIEDPFQYPKEDHAYRPFFREDPPVIHTSLLLTCRRIHAETHAIPLERHVHVAWTSRSPPNRRLDGRRDHGIIEATLIYVPPCPRGLQNLHIFIQQVNLDWWHNLAFFSPGEIASIAPHLKRFRMTLRHSDWWYQDLDTPLYLDAKQNRGEGPQRKKPWKTAEDEFEDGSWGKRLSEFASNTELETFELELETVEPWMRILDRIVERAVTWEFAFERHQRGNRNGGVPDAYSDMSSSTRRRNKLVCKPEKTTRKGWWGAKLRHFEENIGESGVAESIAARKRLEQTGVAFGAEDGENDCHDERRLTYYVVTIVYEAVEVNTNG